MADTKNTQQARDTQQGNGQVPESEQHITHLLPAERELLAECHRHQVYLALCGAMLPVSELQSSYCDDVECERFVTYCQNCLYAAVKTNADAGLVWTPPAGSVLLDSGPAS